jgi:hypothetical protein
MDTAKDKQSPKQEQSYETLFEFVEQNQKLITVLGVFTALTVFANNIPFADFSSLLSFLFLTIALIVWIELFMRAKVANNANWRLKVFENILSLSVFALIGYWLVGYVDTWRSFTFVPLMALFTSLIFVPIRKYSIYQRLNNPSSARFRILKKVLWFFILITITLCSAFAAAKFATPVVEFFQSLKASVQRTP